MRRTTVVCIVLLALFLVACYREPAPQSQISCAVDSDCSCGVHVQTRDCFVGNKAYVDSSQQCPDFCTGIAGHFETRCVEHECRNVNIRNQA